MREFVCGYQSLISCGMEVLGFVLFLCILALLAVLKIGEWWDTRQARKATPHPKCCNTPRRCHGAARCWMVPSCADTESGVRLPTNERSADAE